MKLYALVTEQDTAAAETTLTARQYRDDAIRLAVEQARDDDVTCTWVEVTDNDVCREYVGWKALT